MVMFKVTLKQLGDTRLAHETVINCRAIHNKITCLIVRNNIYIYRIRVKGYVYLGGPHGKQGIWPGLWIRGEAV